MNHEGHEGHEEDHAEAQGWLAAMVLVFGPALLVVAGFLRQEERR